MVIGINLLYLIPGKVGGTEHYARSFINELRKLDHKNTYVVFCNRENTDTFSFPEKNWHVVACPIFAKIRWARILFEQLALPLFIWREKVQVLHSMGYLGPVFTPCRHIITVHDANWRDHPEDATWLENLTARVLVEASLLTSETVITDSPFSTSRLLFHFPFLKSKLHMVQPGVDEAFYAELEKAKKSQSVFPFPYYLTVSAYYPHKRLASLIPFWRRTSRLRPDLHLIVVGKNGRQESLLRQVFNRTDRVHTKGKVSLPTLVRLYAHAEAVIHPSIYEGFGYPVYEAVVAGKQIHVGRAEMYDQRLFSRPKLRQQYQKAARQLLALYSSKPSAPKY